MVGLHNTKLIFLVITSVTDVLSAHSRFEATVRTPFWYRVYFGVIICPSRDVNTTTWLIQAIWRCNKLLYEYKYSTLLHTSRVLDYIIIYRRIDGQWYFLCKCWSIRRAKYDWNMFYTQKIWENIETCVKYTPGAFLYSSALLGAPWRFLVRPSRNQRMGAVIAGTWHQRCRVTTILEFEN